MTTTPTPATTNPADLPGAEQGPVGAPPDTSTLTGPPQIVFTYTTNDGVGNQVITVRLDQLLNRSESFD